jgi:hypothetical protein
MDGKVDRRDLINGSAAIVTTAVLMVLWSAGFDEAFKLP